MNPNAFAAVQAFEHLSWTRVHAVGAVANLVDESGLNPRARGDYARGVPTAFGVAQWHLPRVEDILHNTHIDVRNASLEEQMAAVDWEIRNRYPGALHAVGESTTPYEAAYAFCATFERPFNILQQGTIRGNLAVAIYHEIGA